MKYLQVNNSYYNLNLIREIKMNFMFDEDYNQFGVKVWADDLVLFEANAEAFKGRTKDQVLEHIFEMTEEEFVALMNTRINEQFQKFMFDNKRVFELGERLNTIAENNEPIKHTPMDFFGI